MLYSWYQRGWRTVHSAQCTVQCSVVGVLTQGVEKYVSSANICHIMRFGPQNEHTKGFFY